MNAVRESVGTALPFTIGTALSIWILGSLSPYSGGIVATCALITASVMAYLSVRKRYLPPYAVRTFLCIMLFAAGVFVTLTRSVWLGTETEAAPGPVSSAAAHCAQGLKGLIDSMQYSDTQTPALIKALLTGDRSGLSQETREAFRRSGASHLLALSGMHLGIIYMIISRLLSFVGHGRNAVIVRSVTIVACSGFFTLMTGASPSIVRAFLFILLNETAKVTGRVRNGIHTLCMALVIQLAVMPEIITSVGFQLSYLAMCGIFFLFPTLQRWYPENGRRSITGRIWDAAAMSIACQVFTAPVVWYHFGTFPRYFILTNLLAIPLTTMTIVTSVAVIALSAIGLCPDFLLTANEATVTALRFTLENISAL